MKFLIQFSFGIYLRRDMTNGVTWGPNFRPHFRQTKWVILYNGQFR